MANHNLTVDGLVTEELVSALCLTGPVYKAVGKGCPLATSFKRKKYYKDNFKVVDPIEYILDEKQKRSLQYVLLLKFLQQLLSVNSVLDKALNIHLSSRNREQTTYESFRDGLYYKGNNFISESEWSILYADLVC